MPYVWGYRAKATGGCQKH